MSDTIGLVILAAGKGTRMKIDTPKALAKTAGKCLLDYVVEASTQFCLTSFISESRDWIVSWS